MRIWTFAVFALSLLTGAPRAQETPCDRAATTILVVRHAEKPGQADSLSETGYSRAKTLVHVAGRANVRAIYHSDTKRNRLTAEPLATALGITPTVYPAKDIDALVARIFAEHEGESVLVVGHSNTVARIIAAAGGPHIEDLAENEYDKLFVVTTQPCRRGPAILIELEYGDPSP
jgi:broad specificity phosphatase PhoE